MRITKLFFATATLTAFALPAGAAEMIHPGKWDYQIDMTVKGEKVKAVVRAIAGAVLCTGPTTCTAKLKGRESSRSNLVR